MTKRADQLQLFETHDDFAPPAKATPILKWAGGKKWMIDLVGNGIWGRLQRTRGRYIEPFLGGGALALWLGFCHDRPAMVLGDKVEPLIEFYREVQRNPGKLAWVLSALAIKGVDEGDYYRVRDSFNNKRLSSVQRAARFLYLNRLGYNGLYRENKKGDHNVPYGDTAYRKSVVGRKSRDAIDALFPNKGKLERVSQAFRFADLLAQDFEETIAPADDGDVVYADPPYDGTFDTYSAGGFGQEGQKRLAAVLLDAHERGATIIANNADTELVRELYSPWAEIMLTKEKRSISCDGKTRVRKQCLLITTDSSLVRYG
jgi:DNA adenine methylase